MSTPLTPLGQLTFYPHLITLTKDATTYPVNPEEVALALQDFGFSSGLLPKNTLGWSRVQGKLALSVFIPARRYEVQVVRGQKELSLRIPLPAFLWHGCGKDYKLFALKERPTSERAVLYHAPTPNVFSEGHVCQGNVQFVEASSGQIHYAHSQFMESQFNTHLASGKCVSAPENVLSLWRELDGRKRFPLKELVPLNISLGQIV